MKKDYGKIPIIGKILKGNMLVDIDSNFNKKENISDYTIDDFKLENYQHHPRIKAAMVV